MTHNKLDILCENTVIDIFLFNEDNSIHVPNCKLTDYE